MNKAYKAIATTIALAFAMAMAVGCGQQSAESAESSPSSTSASSIASNAAPADAVYVMVSNTAYDENGNENGTTSYEVDEHGNVTSVEMPLRGSNNSVAGTGVMEYTLDEKGWNTGQVTYDASGAEVASIALTNEKDDQGRVTKSTGESSTGGTVTTTYEYHPNGSVKSITTEQASGAVSVEEFDEAGFCVLQQSTDAGGAQFERHNEWSLDDSGHATGFVATVYQGGTPTSSITWEVTTDDQGNILEERASDSGMAYRIEWERIGDPSQRVRLFAPLKR